MSSKGYEFHESPGSIDLILTKQHGDKTVDIIFKSKQPGDEEEVELDNYQPEEDIEENDEVTLFISNQSFI